MAGLALIVILYLLCGVRAEWSALLSANPPDFVVTSDVRSSALTLLGQVSRRLKCEEYGSRRDECETCLNADTILQLLRVDPSSKQISRTTAEDLAVLVSHQVLYFESMCVSKSSSCFVFEDCQEEVLDIMGRYSSPLESLVKVLRIFKMYLKEDEEHQCFSAGSILDELPKNNYGLTPLQETRQLFAIVMGHIIKGECIEVGESITDFLDDIFHHYGDNCSPFMTLKGLKRMMHDLQSGQGDDHDHDHHHFHHHDHDHENSHACDYSHPHFAPYHDHSSHDHPHPDSHTHSYHEHNDSFTDHYDHHDHPHMGEIIYSSSTATPITNATTTSSSLEDATTTGLPSFMTESVREVESLVSSENSTLNDSMSSTSLANDTAKGHESTNAPANRARRSAQEGTNSPAASLRSHISHSEEEHRLQISSPVDDVKKVYLLRNDDYGRHMDLELNGMPHQYASLAAKCLSAEDLVAKFGHQENSTLTKSDFLDLCPALVQQIVSGVCTEPVKSLPPPPSASETYGYGSLSVFVITLTSLAGVFLIPLMTRSAYAYIVTGFYGLAFSTLAADALLHLMPQFLGLHTHGSGGENTHAHEEDEGMSLEPYLQLQLGLFFTIYALFLFEAVMGLFSNDQPKEKKGGHGHSHALPDKLPTLMSVKTKSETQLPVSRDQSTTSLDTEIVDIDSIKKPPNLMVSKPICFGLTSLAIVVTLGDSVHNFGDGLAIGAAFSTGVRGGLSTAIAVFCHELPHEFGDFVVLLSTGLSFRKALVINFVSGLTCFAGLYLGIYIGDDEVARRWIMAVTAGIFLYVALAEMLPELREHQQGCRWKMLLVKNMGILAGIAVMFLISVYEDKLA